MLNETADKITAIMMKYGNSEGINFYKLMRQYLREFTKGK